MGDYGHDLQFGSFLTPSAADPQRVVRLARLSEQVGLDLATFQDHPYLPSFLDTSTLLAYVAAATTSIRLAANVANLPLRPPAVLARSIASLDLLSGGRVELGLGAGGSWEAIEAMGGPRRTPGESVQALEEAIEVIRSIWDAETRGGVRLHGEHYTLTGAKRGPDPAHDVQIWLGAYKPRMLALTGRLADGWLPSLPYLQPGDLTAGNALIDQSAQAAGRDPKAVRRLLNVGGQFLEHSRGPLQGPAEQWVRELADLALTEGISTFIISSDDPDDLRRFGAEVAPAVRELVAAERATTSGDPVPRASGAAVAVPAPAPVGRLTVVPTPDDGARRSAVSVWDEAERPTGPTPAPGATYGVEQQAQAQLLVTVHAELRSELSQLFDLIEQVAAGTLSAGAARSSIATMTLRQNAWVLGGYCESYCRIVTTHHTIEDSSMFPQLRRADRRLEPVLDRLQIEHHAIHGVLEDVDQALVALVTAPVEGIPRLRAAVDLLSDTLLSHLAYEERELIEPLSRLNA